MGTREFEQKYFALKERGYDLTREAENLKSDQRRLLRAVLEQKVKLAELRWHPGRTRLDPGWNSNEAAILDVPEVAEDPEMETEASTT